MESHLKNLDVKCLRCGVMNIPENRICGACGANLPVIYDEAGKPFTGGALFKQYLPPPKNRTGIPAGVNRTRWILRGLIVLLALWVAYRLMHHT
jgi:hypothetical protein